jgi:signal transduction histidine kinase
VIPVSLRSIFKQHFHRKSHKVAEACAIDREVFAAINEGVLAVAEKSEVVHCTPRLIEMLGVDLTAQPGPPLRDRIAAVMDDRQAFTRFWDEQTRSPQSSASCEFTLAQRRRFVSVHSRPVRDADAGFVARLWVFEDITDRKELEASLMQSQKMEAIGRLAGGVAHDFNNMLMAISGNLELTKMAESRQVSEVIDLIEAAELATDRAAKLVRNLLGFSRQAKLELQVVNANLAIERLIDLLKHTLDPTIEREKGVRYLLCEAPEGPVPGKRYLTPFSPDPLWAGQRTCAAHGPAPGWYQYVARFRRPQFAFRHSRSCRRPRIRHRQTRPLDLPLPAATLC